MNALDRRPLRRAVNGAPRHHHAVCTARCGWRGTRTADSAKEVSWGKRCPTCGARVKAVTL